MQLVVGGGSKLVSILVSYAPSTFESLKYIQYYIIIIAIFVLIPLASKGFSIKEIFNDGPFKIKKAI